MLTMGAGRFHSTPHHSSHWPELLEGNYFTHLHGNEDNKAGTIHTPILQMRTLRPRVDLAPAEGQQPVQGRGKVRTQVGWL